MTNHFVEKLMSLADLSAQDIDALDELTAHSRIYAPRQDLIREGDRPGPVFVVLDGWACRYKILPCGSRQIMAFLLPGDACDLHVGVLSEMDHSLQAITAARIVQIPGAEMAALLAARPRIARAMYKAQLIDEGTLRAWIVSMGRRSSIERVAHLMCELYLRLLNGAPIADRPVALPVALPISQIVLADALGMTPVHVNRLLRDLRLAGAVALARNALTVLDPVKLIHIAGFDENYLHRRQRQGPFPPR